MAIVVKRFFS